MLRPIRGVGRLARHRFFASAPSDNTRLSLTLPQLREFLNRDIAKITMDEFSKVMYAVGKNKFELNFSDISRIVNILQRHRKSTCTHFTTSNILYGTRQYVNQMQPQQLSIVIEVFLYRFRRQNLALPMMGNMLAKCVGSLQEFPAECDGVYELLDELRKPLELYTTRMNPVGVSNIISGIAHLDAARPEVQLFLTALSQCISRTVDRPFNSFEMGMSLYGLRKMKSMNPGVRLLLQELALKLPEVHMEARHIGAAIVGLQNMYVTHEEVLRVLTLLTQKVRECDEVIDAYIGGSLLQGLKYMSSDCLAVCKYLSALTPKLRECDFNLIALGSAFTGMQSLASSAIEVREVLKVLTRKLEANTERMSVAALSRISYGCRSKDSAHAEVRDFLRVFTRKVEQMNSLDGFAIASIFFNLHGMQFCDEVEQLLRVLFDKMHSCNDYKSESLHHVIYGTSAMSSDHEIVRQLMHFVAAKFPSLGHTSRAMTLSGLGLQNKNPQHEEVRQYLSVYADALKNQNIDWRALSNALYGVCRMDASTPEVGKLLTVLRRKIEEQKSIVINDRLSIAFGHLSFSTAPDAQKLLSAISRVSDFYVSENVWEIVADCARLSTLDVSQKEVLSLLHYVLQHKPPTSVTFDSAFAVMKYIQLAPEPVQTDLCEFFASHVENKNDIHQQVTMLRFLSEVKVDGADKMKQEVLRRIGESAQFMTEAEVSLIIADMSQAPDEEWIALANFISQSTQTFKSIPTIELLADVTVSSEGRSRVYHELVSKLATCSDTFVPLPINKQMLAEHPESYRLLSVITKLLKGKLQHPNAIAKGVAALRNMTDESSEVRNYLGVLRDVLIENKATLTVAELYRLLSGLQKMRGCDEVYGLVHFALERLGQIDMNDLTPHKAVDVLLGIQHLSTEVEDIRVVYELVTAFLLSWKGESIRISEYAAALFALRFRRIDSEEMQKTIEAMVTLFVDRDWTDKHIGRALYGLQSMTVDDNVHVLLTKIAPHLKNVEALSPQAFDRILAGVANKLSDKTALDIVRLAAEKADLPAELYDVKNSLIALSSENAAEVVCESRERLGIEEK